MDLLAWMGWFLHVIAIGMAASALKQIASLKEVKILVDDFRRRDLLEHTVGERKVIVPDSLRSE